MRVPGKTESSPIVSNGMMYVTADWITRFHNIAGMLTESAAARLASPRFMHLDQLRGNTRNLPVYGAETIFPNPWPGGWWHLRDIVERQVLWNAYLKGKCQTERGAAGPRNSGAPAPH